MVKEIGEQESQPRRAIGYVLFKDSKVLLERRTDIEHGLFGKYVFPGGHVEEGESSINAARREIGEETGFMPVDMALIDRFEDAIFTEHVYQVEIFLVTQFEGELKDPEHRNERDWFTLEEAEKLLDLDTSKRILQKVKDVLGV